MRGCLSFLIIMKGSGQLATRKTFRNVITSDEIYDKVNEETRKLVDAYLRDFNTGSSSESVKVYKSNFRIFLCWNYMYNDDIPFIKINKRQFRQFFIFGTEELQWGSARYRNMWSSLNSFSEYIEKYYDDVYPEFRNNVKKVDKIPKSYAREKTVFKKEELDGLMNWLGEQGRIEQQCLLAMIMASGMRISETTRMTTDLIDYDNTAFEGLFLETTKQIKTKGKGKNGKPLHKYLILDFFKPYYDAWLPLRQKIMEDNQQTHNYIFIKQDGKPAPVSAMRYWTSDWDKALNGKHWYPHAGRHFWTSYLDSIGLEKQLIQELQGWSSDTLVDLYNDNTSKDKQWKGLAKLRAALNKEKEENG